MEITDAIALLTHPKDVPYLEYVEKVKDNPLAKSVKIADIHHNSDASRMPAGDPQVQWRWENKYSKALEILK